MDRTRLFATLSFLFLAPVCLLLADPALTQPVAPVRPVTDDYFGQKVVDNYRWMEDLASPEVQDWMKGQNAYTRDYLAKLPDQAALIKRVQELDNASTRVGGLERAGNRYFYFKVTPADQTAKLYVREGLDGAERLLVDAQVLGGTGKRFTIGDFYPSPDGSLVAVEIAAGGSEEGVLRVLDVTTGKTLSDSIDRVWEPGVAWDVSNKFFYFTRLQKLGEGKTKQDKEMDAETFLHHVGDSPDNDVIVLSRKAFPDLGMVPTDEGGVAVEETSPYALGFISHGVQREMTLLLTSADALAQGHPTWKKIIDVSDDITGVEFKGKDLWMLSHKHAPKSKILHMSLESPDISKAEVVVPEGSTVIYEISAAKDALYYKTAHGGISQVQRLAYGQTTPTVVPLPFQGAVGVLRTDTQFDGALLRLSGWIQAPQWYSYDPAKNEVVNTHIEPLNPTDMSAITSTEVAATAPDGTPIPLSILYKKDMAMDGSHPCLMEGYGSYGISLEPGFDATRLALLERGIVIAYAHVRGGGENGVAWHTAGMKLTKHNTISDFIACAQYLIDNKYTSAKKLAGRGTSAGGILIGGALTERPDLFGLCICNVGVMDSLRLEQGPNGPPNTPEFGSVKNADGAKALYLMDAYQHVKDGTAYPAVLLITGANDPRVDPWQLLKMTARLQAATSSKNPILLRVDYDAGHGMGSSKQQRDLITADQAALLLSVAGK
jgi:prolyl oligopeptidase